MDKPSWKYRRRFLFAVSTLCGLVIAFVLARNMDSAVAGTAVTMSFTTLISAVGSYVFGATWDDKGR